jgi:ribosomal protein L11 methylase PrmA
MQMGAALSTGIDIDPQTITAAAENLLLNGLQFNQMPVYLVPTNLQPSCFPSTIGKLEEGNKLSNCFDLKSSRGTYDIVTANILLNPLLELVDDIVGYAKPGGTVAVSGILEEQVKETGYIFQKVCRSADSRVYLLIDHFIFLSHYIQVPKVKEVYSRYLDNMLVSVNDGWACLQGTRIV